jgi:hypothetical protein
MLEENIDQKKILRYFQMEGYSEKEILDEITSFEQEKAVKDEPSQPPQI